MADTASSPPPSSPSDLTPPPGFYTLETIRDFPTIKVQQQTLVNVIGFVKDFRRPFKTRKDWKCTIEIKDHSIQYESRGVNLTVFASEESKMPIASVADAVIIRQAKVDIYSGQIQLLTNRNTEILVLQASDIQSSLSGPPLSLWRSFLFASRPSKLPTEAERTYVLAANSHIETLGLPSTEEFIAKSNQSMNIKEGKFSLLGNVQQGKWYDILVEVNKVYYARDDWVSLEVSDYTANPRFFDHIQGGNDSTSMGRDGDEYGYTTGRKTPKEERTGPHGKYSIQITLWDSNRIYAVDHVKVGDWVILKNVLIKDNASCLEGAIHGEEHKINIQLLEKTETPDDRWIAAISRRRDYSEDFERKPKTSGNSANTGEKRKSDEEPSKNNSKARRLERRAAGLDKGAALDAKESQNLNLNELIRCSYPDKPVDSLADILKWKKIFVNWEESPNGAEYLSPFDVAKYRASVRVINYFPDRIEDFAVGRRESIYEMLPDYSGGEDTDVEESMASFRNGKGFPKKTWTWRFALEVEDATPSPKRERTWLIVDNPDGQMLLGLDASDLRRNSDQLQEVKTKLFCLWGDLEEQKSSLAKTRTPEPTSTADDPSSSPEPYQPGDQPPIDSDDEDEQHSPPRELGSNKPSAEDPTATSSPTELTIKNKPFTCCIRQYGVKIDEPDPAKATAGNGKRWERQFGLFGVRIM